MSIDLLFNRHLGLDEIKEKTDLEITTSDTGLIFLKDKYGNSAFYKGYGLTFYMGSKSSKILDELVEKIGIMFIDEDYIETSNEPDIKKLFIQSMDINGYWADGKLVIPERDEEEDYINIREKNDSDFPF